MTLMYSSLVWGGTCLQAGADPGLTRGGVPGQRSKVKMSSDRMIAKQPGWVREVCPLSRTKRRSSAFLSYQQAFSNLVDGEMMDVSELAVIG